MPRDHEWAEGEGRRAHVVLCRLPVALYEWMRLQAFQERRRMNSIALAAITVYRAELEAGRIMMDRRPREGETVQYNLYIGDDLGGWLRTTALHAHTSINAMVIAALIHAHTDRMEGAAATDS